jgi:hypothetical protein
MYFESDAYPELVHSMAQQRIREQRLEEQERQARRERRARRAARVRAVLRPRQA